MDVEPKWHCAVCERERWSGIPDEEWHHTPSLRRGELMCPECFVGQLEPNEDGLTPDQWVKAELARIEQMQPIIPFVRPPNA